MWLNHPVEPCSFLQALVLCFRLHFTKDSITINTAAAAICGLVRDVFERVVTEDGLGNQTTGITILKIFLKISKTNAENEGQHSHSSLHCKINLFCNLKFQSKSVKYMWTAFCLNKV